MPSSHLHAFIDQFNGLQPVTLNPDEVLAALVDLPDPRARRGIRHNFAHLLVIMVCSVVAGAKTLVEMAEWAADTARTELAAHGIGTPHATTLARVLERLDASTMDLLVSDWAQKISAPAAIAVDGKEMRGAKNGKGSRVHLMAAINQDTHAVLAQVSVDEKTNEITAFPTLMDHFMDLKGVVITADALHTQTGHARYLAGRGAHYIFTVKGNQPTLLEQLEQSPWEEVPAGNRTRSTANGRTMIRTVKCATLSPGIRFPHAAQAIQITRKSRPFGEKSWHVETVYAVTSLPTHQASPAQLGAWVRGHWGIENGLHWRRDVVWLEDKSQIRTGNSPHAMAILRNIAITLLKRAGHTNIAKATRKLKNYPGQTLEIVGISSR